MRPLAVEARYSSLFADARAELRSNVARFGEGARGRQPFCRMIEPVRVLFEVKDGRLASILNRYSSRLPPLWPADGACVRIELVRGTS